MAFTYQYLNRQVLHQEVTPTYLIQVQKEASDWSKRRQKWVVN